tara:strand:- start:241 stop:951 length:711 start_codon:yes stop_codon:yes gene_type:complete
MVDKFIFDVDGTLTPSRQQIDDEFAVFFSTFCAENDVYLVTGSDRDKTVEQVSEEVYSLAKRVYNCSGSDVYEGNNNVYTNNWRIPDEARKWLKDECRISEFPLRTGLHIEERPGMVNFSVVGRNATMGERKLYVKFDNKTKERIRIAKEFQMLFPTIQAVVGGETGIDIFPRGSDKSQIIRDFDPNDTLHFFGDRMDPAGNDYPLKKIMLDNDLGICYNVRDYKHTWKLLKEYGS